MADVAAVEELTGYHFCDADMAHEALTAAGVVLSCHNDDPPQVGSHGNKRLALVGDALIRLVVVDNWFPSGTSPGVCLYCPESDVTDELQLRGRRASVTSVPIVYCINAVASRAWRA